MSLSKDAKCIDIYFKSIGDNIKQSAEDIEKSVVSDMNNMNALSFGHIISTIIKKIKKAPDLVYDYVHNFIKQKWTQYINYIMMGFSMSACCLCIPYILCGVIIMTLINMISKTDSNNNSNNDILDST